MLAAPLYRVAHGLEHNVPAHAKAPSRFGPAQYLGPALQEPRKRDRDVRLAGRPRHQLDDHPTARALHPARRVQQEHRDVPQRNELEATLGQTIVASSALAAVSADPTAALTLSHVHVDRKNACQAHKLDCTKDESGLLGDAIEDNLHLHRVGLVRCGNPHPGTMRLSAAASSRVSLRGHYAVSPAALLLDPHSRATRPQIPA